MYYWTAKSDDGAFQDKSKRSFQTKKDAYNNMRDAVLEKMKWNTEYDEDFIDEDDIIDYCVTFGKNEIVHSSYSGTYTYKIMKDNRENEIDIIIEMIYSDPE